MIYDLLLPCQYGMQLDNIPYAFRDAHCTLLPKHWKLIVQVNLTRLFKTEEIPNHRLYARRTPNVRRPTLLNCPRASCFEICSLRRTKF